MTENELSWASTRTKYSVLFGAEPAFVDANDIGALFRKHPAAVIAELDRAAKSHAAGKLHSPWRAVHKTLDRISGDHEHVDVNSDLRVRQAESWIRNAGIYCTETEVVDELFSDRGGGKGYSGGLLRGLQDQLGERMLTLWRQEQPRGAAADAEFRARAKRNAALYHEHHPSNRTEP